MERLEDHALNIFTDGSMYERPRRGGYAFIFVTTAKDGTEHIDEFSPDGVLGASSQEMEVRALAEALKVAAGRRSPVDLARFTKIVVYTDSTTVHRGFESAKFSWSKNRWRRAGGAPVIHAEIWKEVVAAVRKLPVPVHAEWARGKSSRLTKIADKLAKDSASRPYARPSMVRTVRRKRTPQKAEAGGVEGQELDIQIITAEYLSVQKCLRYKYEVLSKDRTRARSISCSATNRCALGTFIAFGSTTTQATRRSPSCWEQPARLNGPLSRPNNCAYHNPGSARRCQINGVGFDRPGDARAREVGSASRQRRRTGTGLGAGKADPDRGDSWSGRTGATRYISAAGCAAGGAGLRPRAALRPEGAEGVDLDVHRGPAEGRRRPDPHP